MLFKKNLLDYSEDEILIALLKLDNDEFEDLKAAMIRAKAIKKLYTIPLSSLESYGKNVPLAFCSFLITEVGREYQLHQSHRKQTRA